MAIVFRLTPLSISPILELARKMPNAQCPMPNAQEAIVDVGKLVNYALSTEHPVGKHKARVFASTLGLTVRDAEMLKATILEAALIYDAVATDRDLYGQRFVIDFLMIGDIGRAWVRGAWIIRDGETFPRLTSCYVL